MKAIFDFLSYPLSCSIIGIIVFVATCYMATHPVKLLKESHDNNEEEKL